MKKSILSLILFCICFTGVAQWSFVDTEGISTTWSFNELEIDTTGSPVVATYESVLYKASCLRFDGMHWITQGNPSLEGFPITSIDEFIIDKNNQYYLLFTNNDYELSCVKYDGKEWKYVGANTITKRQSTNVAMAIDSYGVVYVVHPTWSNGTIIVKESGGSWVPVSTSGLPASMAFPSIKFDSNNVAYLAYTGGDTGFGLQANCSKLLNNKWIHVGNSNISSSSSAASYTNLQITKSNEIYIGFDDPYISCYKFNNEINYWKMIGTSGMGGNYGGLTDLISDSNSNIYISTSQISGDKAMCFTFNGSDWVMVGNSPISESYASSPNIAVNNYGKIYAAYSDANLNKAVVKEYNVPTGTANFTKKDMVLIYPNPSSAFFNVEFDRQKFDVAVYEIKGNLIAEYHDINVKLSVNTNVFKKGIYIVKVSTGNDEPYYGKLIIQ